MSSFQTYFRCGSYYPKPQRSTGDFRVRKFSDICEKIIPVFTEHLIRGVKALDFQDFCKVAELMKTKSHLTPEGLALISNIRAGVNLNRGRNPSVSPV